MSVLRLAVTVFFALWASMALAQGKTTATLRLDWVPGPHHTGPILAAKRGYYTAEGLDLAVKPGRGSGNTVQVVASGGDMFGFADAGTMAVAASKGAKVIMVANVTQRGPIGIINLGKKIESPKELAGKSYGLVPGESPHIVLQAVFRKYGIADSAVRTVSVDPAVKVAALLTKKVDAISGFVFGDYLRAKVSNPDVKITLFSDWGVNLLGNGYLVQTATLEQQPKLVSAFLRATLRGWKDVIAEPKAGIDALMEAFPETSRPFVEAGLPLVIDHMHSAATKNKALGWMAEEDWKGTLEVMKNAGLEGNQPPSAYYRNLVEQ